MWNEEELMNQLDAYFSNTTEEQLLRDLEETGSLEFMEKVDNEFKLPDNEFSYEFEGTAVAHSAYIRSEFDNISKGFSLGTVSYQQGNSKNYSSFFTIVNREINDEDTTKLPIGA
ncbi:hypothetical protein C2I06_22515 [Niallia circulans]|uniref:hypothetical protein n=1 Tax=Niallia circulans TaxID=1397 RepID=UPI000F450114|nr:hypothetical protein [Niallia circulans]AYV69396.1 hypothetical protein C2I06_22515 [Niallia circulans]